MRRIIKTAKCKICKKFYTVNAGYSIGVCSVSCFEIRAERKKKHLEFIKQQSALKTKQNIKKNKIINRQRNERLKRYNESFYTSKKWLSVRFDVLNNSKKECNLCGSKKKPFHVDHVKPRSSFPHLELDINNLQVLCSDCNLGKSNKMMNDSSPNE